MSHDGIEIRPGTPRIGAEILGIDLTRPLANSEVELLHRALADHQVLFFRDAFLDYHDLGITTFLIRGFEPLKDAAEYGRSLLPATRHLLASRSQGVAAE